MSPKNLSLLTTALLLFCEGAVAGTTAAIVSKADPWVWIIGGFGAAIVYVKNPPTSRADALVNGMISVMIGGLIAPPVAEYCGEHFDAVFNQKYAMSFVLSASWPWLLPVVSKFALKWFSKETPKKTTPRKRKTDVEKTQ